MHFHSFNNKILFKSAQTCNIWKTKQTKIWNVNVTKDLTRNLCESMCESIFYDFYDPFGSLCFKRTKEATKQQSFHIALSISDFFAKRKIYNWLLFASCGSTLRRKETYWIGTHEWIGYHKIASKLGMTSALLCVYL